MYVRIYGVYRDGLGYMGVCKVYVLLLVRARSLCDERIGKCSERARYLQMAA